MFEPDQYQLCDFGGGRKLERFGGVLVDRPAPGALGSPRDADAWAEASARFEREQAPRLEGKWSVARPLPAEWLAMHGGVAFAMELAPAGQTGLFAEQAPQWDWLDAQTRQAGPALEVLNLFGYTGGATLTATMAGAAVVHVDAAKGNLRWARRNAELSGLRDKPTRWIHEDALAFVRREIKRGREYHGVVLDPPTYGHGPNGQEWRLDRDLPELLAGVAALTRARRGFVLLTSHTPGFGPRELATSLAGSLDADHSKIEAGELELIARDGRSLPSGAFARFP
jgi:23S rRNA (cytosine1962-C5)-methyltransferase